MNTDDVLLELVREVRALRAEVRALGPRRGLDLGMLSDLLVVVYAFARSGAWTAAELIEDARRAGRRDVLEVVDRITGDRGDPAKRMGRFLARHAEVEVEGLRLVRIRLEAGTWIWGVESR